MNQKGKIYIDIILSLCFLTLIFSFFLIKKQHLNTELGSDLSYALPSDVKGSDKVAVASYTNANGTFVLWSSGRITNSAGVVKNTPTAYSTAQNTLPATGSGITGSPNVAIGIVPCISSNNTCVLFSNGSIKMPNDTEASAPIASGPWTRDSGKLYPIVTNDMVAIGTPPLAGTELQLNSPQGEEVGIRLHQAATHMWDWRMKANDSKLYLTENPHLSASSADRMVIDTFGSVGIGTTNPPASSARQLYISGSNSLGGGAYLTLDSTTGPQAVPAIDFIRGGDFINRWEMAYDLAAIGGADNNFFITRPSGGSRMFSITPTGNVGIGTTSPTYKLDVDASGGAGFRIASQNTIPTNIITSACGADGTGATSLFAGYSQGGTKLRFTLVDNGNAYATGSWVSNGLDYAEYFENLDDGVIEKGTIVSLEQGKLKQAQVGDAFIVGVVSTSPAIIGNNGNIKKSRGKHPKEWTLVALMGQVPVKVNGFIRHGDYIELDDNGIGKKAEKWHPEVIGRAMEDFNSQKVGKIKILVK